MSVVAKASHLCARLVTLALAVTLVWARSRSTFRITVRNSSASMIEDVTLKVGDHSFRLGGIEPKISAGVILDGHWPAHVTLEWSEGSARTQQVPQVDLTRVGRGFDGALVLAVKDGGVVDLRQEPRTPGL